MHITSQRAELAQLLGDGNHSKHCALSRQRSQLATLVLDFTTRIRRKLKTKYGVILEVRRAARAARAVAPRR